MYLFVTKLSIFLDKCQVTGRFYWVPRFVEAIAYCHSRESVFGFRASHYFNHKLPWEFYQAFKFWHHLSSVVVHFSSFVFCLSIQMFHRRCRLPEGDWQRWVGHGHDRQPAGRPGNFAGNLLKNIVDWLLLMMQRCRGLAQLDFLSHFHVKSLIGKNVFFPELVGLGGARQHFQHLRWREDCHHQTSRNRHREVLQPGISSASPEYKL